MNVNAKKYRSKMSGAAAAEQRIRDIEKAFDRVWHDCLLSKLKPLAISGKCYGLINFFLAIQN